MTSRLPWLVGGIAITTLLGGCGYERQSLDVRAVVDDLRSAALPSPAPTVNADQHLLTPAQVASLAVVLQPDLRRRRAEAGVADAQVIAAGLMPNPTIDAKTYFAGGGPSGDAGLLFDVTDVLALRGPRQDAARLRRGQVRWQIVDAEWRAAHAARLAWIDVAQAEARLTLAQQQVELAERTADLLERGRAGGNASDLDAIQARLQAGLAHQTVAARQAERDTIRLALNRLLGLPPAFVLPIGHLDTGGDLTVSGDPEQVVADLPQRRPDLIALMVAYDVNEEELRGAYRKWIPHLSLGPALSFGDGTKTGLALGIELPLFNHGQAEIATGEAGRTTARETLRSALVTAWSEAATAAQRATSQQTRLTAWNQDIAPLLEREVTLLTRSAAAGEVDPSRLIQAQERILELRDQEIGLGADLQRAAVAWDEAIGPPPMEQPPESGAGAGADSSPTVAPHDAASR